MQNYNLKFKISTFLIVILIFTFLFFNFVQAALVPCGPGVGSDCTFCDLLKLAENVFEFAIYAIAIPLAVISIIAGGFTIMTAGGNPEKVKKGRQIIQAAAVGVIIALASWLIIDAILKILAQGGGIPSQWWNPRANIRCY